jgi:Fibronectin type III domain
VERPVSHSCRSPLRHAVSVLTAYLALTLAPAATAAPTRPAGLRATAVTPTSIAVAWVDRARGETRYEVRVGSHTARLAPNARRYRAAGLQPDRAYVVRVRACRATSCSRWTPPLARLTLDATPGPPPVLGGCQVLPASSAWNRDVRTAALDPHSGAYIAASLAGHRVHLDFGSTERFYGIPWTAVPASTPANLAEIVYGTDGADYSDESDPGPMPIPHDAPIEGWDGPGADPTGGDRHVLALHEGACRLYELYNAVRRPGGFRVSSSAVWDLGRNQRRPAGFTSADAAGLPILPGLLRYDEAATGEIRHAIRFTVSRAQRAYVAPASHLGTQRTPACLPYGARLRLRASFDERPYTGPALAIVRALKRYGMVFADQGSPVYLSGTSDPRWASTIEAINQDHPIPGAAFEVIRLGAITRDWAAGPVRGGC